MRRQRRIALIVACAGLAASIAASASGQGTPAPRLDPPATRLVAESYHARGFDLAAPRALVLWRWDLSGFTRLATTYSDREGRFDFGVQPLPASEMYFHVCERGERPDAEALLRVVRRLRAPVILSGGLDGETLTLVPAEAGGEFRIYDARSGRLLHRQSTQARGGEHREIDLESLVGPTRPAELWIEQVLDAGRRSERRFFRLD